MNKVLLIRHEAATMLRMAGPLILAQLFQTASGVVDTVMAGRFSAIDLAGVAVGSSIFFPIFLLQIGLLSAVTPLVAQAHGRGRPEEIRSAIRLGMLIGGVSGTLLMVVLWLIRPVLGWMGIAPEVIPVADGYLFAVSWGLPLGGLFFPLRNGGDGLARPRLSMLAGLAGLLCNIAANRVLIYGDFGLPSLGGVGCGWATSLSILVMMLVMAWLLARSREPGVRRLFVPGRVGTLAEALAFLRLGTPLGCYLFIECSIFTIIALCIARMGPESVAAHQIAASCISLLYMVPYSLGIVLTVRVGFTIGKRRPHRLHRIAGTGLGMALGCALLTGACLLLFANPIASLYTTDVPVRTLAASLLWLGACIQIPDALQICFGGILRGCKDTRVPLLLMLAAYWGVGVPLSSWLGFAPPGGLQPGPHGFWIGIFCALSTLALLLGGRVRLLLRRLTAPQPGLTAGRP
ncbi:MAG: MATE family efflux transporter [Desulfobulbus sp.]